MKIKLTSSLAGAEVLPAGTVLDTTEKEAKSLIAAGYAVAYTEDEAEIQTAESRGFQEREIAITAKRRKRHK